jgi:hypothetical protein
VSFPRLLPCLCLSLPLSKYRIHPSSSLIFSQKEFRLHKRWKLTTGPSGCQNNDCHYGHEYGMSIPPSLPWLVFFPPTPINHLPKKCRISDNPELDDDQCQELSLLAKQIPCPFARNKKCHYDDESCTYGYVPFHSLHMASVV